MRLGGSGEGSQPTAVRSRAVEQFTDPVQARAAPGAREREVRHGFLGVRATSHDLEDLALGHRVT
jgi:hypothetical protein